MEGAARGPAWKAWRELAGRLGRVAAALLVAQNFLYMFAPLFFLLNLGATVDRGEAGEQLIVSVSDPGLFLEIGDVAGILGFALLASALVSVILGVELGRRPPRLAGMVPGAIAFACVAVLPLVMTWVEGKPRGAPVGNLDAAVAAGGWGVGSVVVLAGSLAYLLFTLWTGRPRWSGRQSSIVWPAFAAIAVVGATPFADLIRRAGEADRNPYTLTFALGIQVLLIPALATIAYRDLFYKIVEWASGEGALAMGTPTRPPTRRTEFPRSPPRPEFLLLPPPPDD